MVLQLCIHQLIQKIIQGEKQVIRWSYLGSACVQAERDTDSTDGDGVVVFDEWRGFGAGDTNCYARPLFSKDFAIAYDRVICLRDGQYRVHFHTFVNTDADANAWGQIRINGQAGTQFYIHDANYGDANGSLIRGLKRGDYVQVFSFCNPHGEAEFQIYRL